MLNIVNNFLTPGSKNRPGTKLKSVKAVAVHWVANPGSTPAATRNWFERGEVYGSTQYCVGIDGTVQRYMPDDELAYHIGSTEKDPFSGKIYTDAARELFGTDVCEKGMPNYYAIGVECCHPDWAGKFTDATLASLRELCDELQEKFPESKLITHHAVCGWKTCPEWFKNHPEDWHAFCLSTRAGRFVDQPGYTG